ncbi:hypothetical protein Bpro_1768 [Polaromonas sp. JS666]|nr:hypothetical protein Bpro_1768 [Polaromonas sp. JS666]
MRLAQDFNAPVDGGVYKDGGIGNGGKTDLWHAEIRAERLKSLRVAGIRRHTFDRQLLAVFCRGFGPTAALCSGEVNAAKRTLEGRALPCAINAGLPTRLLHKSSSEKS